MKAWSCSMVFFFFGWLCAKLKFCFSIWSGWWSALDHSGIDVYVCFSLCSSWLVGCKIVFVYAWSLPQLWLDGTWSGRFRCCFKSSEFFVASVSGNRNGESLALLVKKKKKKTSEWCPVVLGWTSQCHRFLVWILVWCQNHVYVLVLQKIW